MGVRIFPSLDDSEEYEGRTCMQCTTTGAVFGPVFGSPHEARAFLMLLSIRGRDLRTMSEKEQTRQEQRFNNLISGMLGSHDEFDDRDMCYQFIVDNGPTWRPLKSLPYSVAHEPSTMHCLVSFFLDGDYEYDGSTGEGEHPAVFVDDNLLDWDHPVLVHLFDSEGYGTKPLRIAHNEISQENIELHGIQSKKEVSK